MPFITLPTTSRKVEANLFMSHLFDCGSSSSSSEIGAADSLNHLKAGEQCSRRLLKKYEEEASEDQVQAADAGTDLGRWSCSMQRVCSRNVPR